MADIIKQIRVFASEAEAKAFLNELPNAATNSLENSALKEVAQQGVNPYKIFGELYGNHQVQEQLGELGQSGNSYPTDLTQPPIQSATWGTAAGRYYRPPKGVFLDMEQRFDVPTYTKVWKPVEDGWLNRQMWMEPFQKKALELQKEIGRKQRDAYGLILDTARGSDAEANLINQFKLDSNTVLGVRDWFKTLLSQTGVDSDKFFQNAVKIKAGGGIDSVFPEYNMPKDVSKLEDYIRTGEIPVSLQVTDIRRLMNSYMHSIGFDLHVADPWNSAAEVYNTRVNRGVPTYVATKVKNYLDDIRGFSSPNDRAIMEGLGREVYRIGRMFTLKFGEPPITKQDAYKAGRIAFGIPYTLNYSANLAFRTAAVARQYLQTVQTTLPRFGSWATFGPGGGVQRVMTREGRELAYRAGLLMEEMPFASEGGLAPIGGKLFRTSDNVQRAIAGLAQDTLVQRNLPLATSDWGQFLRKTSVEFYHPIEQARIKQMFESGNVMQGRLELMRMASEDTQWIYRQGNRPEFFRGIGGRVFGQYGIWPAYYAEYLHQMLTRGSYQGRVGWATRWVASQAATNAFLNATLGASAASWLFFGPLAFSGGPLFQIASNIPKAFGSGPEAQLARGRLKQQIPGQFIPGFQAMKDVHDAMQQRSIEGMIRELLGYPERK